MIFKDRLSQLFAAHGKFSDATFGKDRSPLGPLNHLLKEVQETLDAPHDREEYADCLLLLIDAFRLSGNGGAHDLLNAAFDKLGKNKNRTWGKPNKDGVVEHVKSRCCGRCDGHNDICVADMVCEEHIESGCEVCFGEKNPQ